MSTIGLLSRRAKSACDRLLNIYELANTSPSPPPELLPTALKELGIVSEALQRAIQELTHQNEEIEKLQSDLGAERQRYSNLFECLPEGCIVTDPNSVVVEMNRAGSALFNIQPHALIGQPLSSLVCMEDLSLFESKLSQIVKRDCIEVSVRLHRRPASFFNATLTTHIVRQNKDEISYLQWLIQDVTERKRAEAALENPDYNPGIDRVLFHFAKGEIIPLENQSIWFVSEGIVKLSTMSERGEEMLIGLVGESMVFGPSLTALQTYQAIALVNVKLALIPTSEVVQSPRLAQTLLLSLKQRLQQTESLLSIYGQIRVEERLNSLLNLLKQAIGQPVEQGIRLCARLTHQDFASGCRTTRVTITRLLGKLQEQGKISQDEQNHLVLKDGLVTSEKKKIS